MYQRWKDKDIMKRIRRRRRRRLGGGFGDQPATIRPAELDP